MLILMLVFQASGEGQCSGYFKKVGDKMYFCGTAGGSLTITFLSVPLPALGDGCVAVPALNYCGFQY